MKNYLVNSLGCNIVVYPTASQVSLGDVLMYDWDNDGTYDQAGICADFCGSTPIVCAHSNVYHSSSWTMGAAKYAVIKLNGIATLGELTPPSSVLSIRLHM